MLFLWVTRTGTPNPIAAAARMNQVVLDFRKSRTEFEGSTVTVSVDEWDIEPLVSVKVTTYFPGVEELNVQDDDAVDPSVMLVGLQYTVRPLVGETDVLRVKLPPNPFWLARSIDALLDEPEVKLIVVGTEAAKSGAADRIRGTDTV